MILYDYYICTTINYLYDYYICTTYNSGATLYCSCTTYILFYLWSMSVAQLLSYLKSAAPVPPLPPWGLGALFYCKGAQASRTERSWERVFDEGGDDWAWAFLGWLSLNARGPRIWLVVLQLYYIMVRLIFVRSYSCMTYIILFVFLYYLYGLIFIVRLNFCLSGWLSLFILPP